MNMTGKIKGIKYKKMIGKNLNQFSLEKFDINSADNRFTKSSILD